MSRGPTHPYIPNLDNGGDYGRVQNGAHARGSLPVLTVADIVGLVACLKHEAAVGSPCWRLSGDAGPRGGAGVCSERMTAYLRTPKAPRPPSTTPATSPTTEGSR